jgi:hypothetical protein
VALPVCSDAAPKKPPDSFSIPLPFRFPTPLLRQRPVWKFGPTEQDMAVKNFACITECRSACAPVWYSRWLARRRVTHPVAPHRQGHCSKSDGHRKNSELLLSRPQFSGVSSQRKKSRGVAVPVVQERAKAKKGGVVLRGSTRERDAISGSEWLL